MAVVYAVQAAPGGLVKIGVAADFSRRLSQLRGASPVPLVVLATVPGGYESEALLARLLTDHRSHAEWYHPADAVMRVVDAMRVCGGMDYADARDAFRQVVAATVRVSAQSVANMGTDCAELTAAIRLGADTRTGGVHGPPALTRENVLIHGTHTTDDDDL